MTHSKELGQPLKENIIPWEADNVFRVTSSDTFEVLVDDESVVIFNFAKVVFTK